MLVFVLLRVYFKPQRKQITRQCHVKTRSHRSGSVRPGPCCCDRGRLYRNGESSSPRASERDPSCVWRSAGPAAWRLWLGCLSPSSLRQRLCKGTAQPGQAGAIYSAALQSTHWWRASRVCARRRIKGSIPAMRVNKGRSEREGEAQKGPVCVCAYTVHIRPS